MTITIIAVAISGIYDLEAIQALITIFMRNKPSAVAPRLVAYLWSKYPFCYLLDFLLAIVVDCVICAGTSLSNEPLSQFHDLQLFFAYLLFYLL